jgi:hypothetical protein
MAFREINPKLLLNFKEYVETWVALIQEYHQRGVSDDGIFTALDLGREAAMRFSMELSSMLLVIAMRAWNAKRIKEEMKSLVAQAVVEKTYRAVFAQDEETLSACKEFYQMRYGMFAELAPDDVKSEKQIRAQLIGFARYVVAQCSERPEEENTQVIERLSVLLIAAAGSFKRLTNNSTPDLNTVFGKPRFIVQK